MNAEKMSSIILADGKNVDVKLASFFAKDFLKNFHFKL